MLRTLAVVTFVAGHVSAAFAAGNMEAGRVLAGKWCSGCHALPSSTSASDAAPSFTFVAKQHQGDRSWVRAWLMTPHPPMEGINLTRNQIDDVTAYLQSLPTN